MKAPRRKDLFARPRIAASFAVAAMLAGLGVCVRMAEYNQIGSDNHASLWVFAAAGLSAYYGALGIFVRARRKRRGARRENS